ncbi:MAG: hypothetical protein ACPIDR_06240 [Candidatus Puniceispirillaceae bacterium]
MATYSPADKLAYVATPAQLAYLPDAGPTWLRPVACQPLAAFPASLPADQFLPLAGGQALPIWMSLPVTAGPALQHGAPILPAINLPAQIRTGRERR